MELVALQVEPNPNEIYARRLRMKTRTCAPTSSVARKVRLLRGLHFLHHLCMLDTLPRTYCLQKVAWKTQRVAFGATPIAEKTKRKCLAEKTSLVVKIRRFLIWRWTEFKEMTTSKDFLC